MLGLGVSEYWQLDPAGGLEGGRPDGGDLLDTPMKGGRLRGGRYEPIRVEEASDGRVAGCSDVLSLELRVWAGELRFRDRETGEELLSYEEGQASCRAAEARIAELEVRLRVRSNLSRSVWRGTHRG